MFSGSAGATPAEARRRLAHRHHGPRILISAPASRLLVFHPMDVPWISGLLLTRTIATNGAAERPLSLRTSSRIVTLKRNKMFALSAYPAWRKEPPQTLQHLFETKHAYPKQVVLSNKSEYSLAVNKYSEIEKTRTCYSWPGIRRGPTIMSTLRGQSGPQTTRLVSSWGSQ